MSDFNTQDIAEFDNQFLFDNFRQVKNNIFIRKNLHNLHSTFSDKIQEGIMVNLVNNNNIGKIQNLQGSGKPQKQLPGQVSENEVFRYGNSKAQHQWNFKYFEAEKGELENRATKVIDEIERSNWKIQQNKIKMMERFEGSNSELQVINQESLKITVVPGLESHEEQPSSVVRDLSTSSDHNNFRLLSHSLNMSYEDYFFSQKQDFVKQTLGIECRFREVMASIELQNSYSLNIQRPKTLVIDILGIFIESFDGSKLVLRPHTISFLKCVHLYFELIAFSNMDANLLRKVVMAIEDEINKPLLHSQNISIISSSSEVYARNVIEEPQKYFNMIIGRDHFTQENGYMVEDLSLLHINREVENIILMANVPHKVAAALQKGYSALPVVHTETFELILAENYLLTQRHCENSRNDFSYLISLYNQYTQSKN